MKSNELRIGNFIDLKVNVPNVGVQYYSGGVVTALRENDLYANGIRLPSYFNAEPILLTEEWLLKFGFEETRSLWNNGMGYPVHYDLENKNLRMAYGSHGGTVFPVVAFNVKFVHQLQNLYFALTGTELEIKETVTP